MAIFRDIERELAEVLYDNITNKRGNLSYKETADALVKRLGRDVNPHYGLRNPLGNVSTLCHELGLPLISARVTRQYTGASNEPPVGEGFYQIACELRPEYKSMTPDAAWRNEIRLIRECSDWHRLREFLDGKPIAAILNSSVASPVDSVPIQDMPTPEEQPVTPVTASQAADPVFPDEVETSTGPIQEGAVKPVYVNVRERNPAARKKCIDLHGTACAVCGIDLGDIYGEEFSGKIHVHHLKPISEYNGAHDIDPVNDLRPVCPNCHMVIHCRQDTPYTIEEVKAFIASMRSKA